ncbi:MAG: heavy metal translocating P-type ATPase, partial [Salaquimonas sp.]
MVSDRIEDAELRHSAVSMPNGFTQYVFSAPSIHCGSCIRIIEKELTLMPGVKEVRVNLTLKRVVVTLESGEVSPVLIVHKLEDLGFSAQIFEPGGNMDQLQKRQSSSLLRAMAVAGFSAMNIMLLSVSTWSGADGATRDLFHLISALIAVPTVAYSGQVFFISALKALRHGHLNMDVPISLAVVLALGMSIFETLNHGETAYFDAAVSLLFFLLIGRYLDQLMRERARNAVNSLSRLAAKGGTIVRPSGELYYMVIDEIEPGMVLHLLPGDKIPVDGRIVSGITDLDLSLVTGESAPVTMGVGDEVQAGTHNLTGVIRLEVLRPAKESFLAEVAEMLSAAENGRGAYVRIADRMAKLYAPAVHLLALFAFIGWMFSTGGDWHQSLYIA